MKLFQADGMEILFSILFSISLVSSEFADEPMPATFSFMICHEMYSQKQIG